MITIAVGCDQAGFLLKQEIIKHLEEKGFTVKDYGSYNEEAVDYPDYAKSVACAILNNEADKGILICGTGIGISIAANRYKGIRAALCIDSFSARATRLHNDANILALGARVIGVGSALDVVDTFFETEFSNEERHINRVKKIELD